MNTRRSASGLSTRTRRRAALIATLMMPLSLMSAPAIAEGPTPPPTLSPVSTTPPGATSDPGLKTAWDKAAKTGKPVEVPSRFTETMKVWANPDGKNMRAELHTRPVQLKNPASGAWEPIDTSVVSRDGKLQAARVKTPLTFGGRGAKHLVSAADKHGEIGLSVTRALPEPKVSGNAVAYPDAVAPGADLVVLAQADGFISQVVFRQRPTGPVTVRLPLTLPEGTTFGETPQGLPQLKDAKGKAKAAPIVLTATDAKVEAAPEQGRTSSVKAQVETTGKTSELVFSPDEKFLADPAVTYPVTVAASSIWFGGGAPDDAWISKNDPYNNNSAAGYLRAGTTSTSADIARAYMKFDTTDPVLQGATVNDADLRMWNYKSGGPNGQLCGETMGVGIRAARVTSDWTLDGTIDSLDWYNQPSSTAPETVNYSGYNYDADPASWCAKDEELFYEVTAMTRAWIQQGVPNHGIVLKAASETAAINWRQYYSSQFGGGAPYPGYRHPPALIIDYTPAQVSRTMTIRMGAPLSEQPTYDEVIASRRSSSSMPVVPDLSEDQNMDRRVSSGKVVLHNSSLGYEPPEDATEEEWLRDLDLSDQGDESNGPAPVPGLVAGYGMDEGTGVSVADSSGQNNTGTGTSTTVVDGKYGKALSFDGTSSWVTVPDTASLRLTTGMTLSAWVNPASVANWRSVVGKELGTGGVSYTLYASNGAAPSGWAQDAPGSSATVDGMSPLSVNTWSHLALTYDGAALRLFVNGQQVAQTDFSGSLYSDGSPLRIGGNQIWREYFHGLIDEVRVYNRAQSAAEIQTDMNTPLSQPQPPDTQAPTAPGSLAATGGPNSASLTWTAATDNVDVMGYTIHRSTTPGFTPSSANQVGSAEGTSFLDPGLTAGTYYYQVRAVDAAGNMGPASAEASATATEPPANEGLMAAYGMNEGSGTTVGDASGHNNTGAATDTTWTTGKHGNALSFNGLSSWVTVPHDESLRLMNTLTFSAWVRPVTVDGWRTVLWKENADDASYGLYSSVDDVPLGTLQNATTTKSVVGDDPLPLNQWSHLAVTYDGTIVTLYLNGTQIDQTPMTGNLRDDGGVLHLGGNAVWDEEFYSGLIDEVRIYNRVQTATEIQADMNTPIGAAAAPSGAAQAHASVDDLGTGIEKLAVDGSRTAGGVTVTSTLTPRLSTWVAAGRDAEAKVDVEIARTPAKHTKLTKTSKTTEGEHLIWSGSASLTAGSVASVQIPEGKLADGSTVRWRARTTIGTVPGAWSSWQVLKVDLSAPTESAPAKTTQKAVQQANAGRTFNYRRIEQEDCQDEIVKQYGALGAGMYANTHNMCMVFWMDGPIYQDKERTKWLGKWKARVTMVAHSYVGSTRPNMAARGKPGLTSRQFNVWARVDTVTCSAQPNYCNPRIRIGLQNNTGQLSSCMVTNPDGIEKTLQQWKDGGDTGWQLTSKEPIHVGGPAKKSWCGVGPWVKSPDVDDKDDYFYPLEEPYLVRCDSSTFYKYYTGACIMWDPIPVFVLDGAKDTKVVETARHVRKALDAPQSTLPAAPAGQTKSIPGRFNPNDPTCRRGAYESGCLWRTTNESLNSTNRTEAQRACRRVNGGEWRKPLSCDEYPMAATYQGVSRAGINYSVSLHDYDDNCKAGLRLKNFNVYNRLLDMDPFWVWATLPGEPPYAGLDDIPPPVEGVAASCQADEIEPTL
ncbi:LamG-like jellyroll fold domain-containing protein [Nonomuraea zeae]|uniref:DNRLRE domain-containing protein n=1 Tax=Nonomuraea zeae TaxID=1642303 RepID=A0A5S4GSV9_9ACTN|nr:LamG-like jellyroll fold domain-containing protein [Nonomuraea zeae]TMR35574.1 DNRLRE domain-containing protein [Nonomuraea zeae]